MLGWIVRIALGDLEVAAISGHKSMQMLRRYMHGKSSTLRLGLV